MKSALTILAILIAATSAVSSNLHDVQAMPLTTLKAPVALHHTGIPSTLMDTTATTADQQAQILRRCHRGHSHGGLEVPLYCPNGVDDVEEEDEEEMVVKPNHNGVTHIEGVGDVAEDEQATFVRRNHNGVIHVEGVDSAEVSEDLVRKRVAEPSHDGEDNGVN